jgi:ABC-type sugar transport system substrate-binding protein
VGKAKLSFRLVKPEPDESSISGRLIEAIRSAVAGDALIVELDDDPAYMESLYDADARGVVILALDRPLPARGNKLHAWISYESLAGAGQRIVQAVLEGARLFHYSTKDRVVVIENRTPHRYRAERIAALTDALRAAGRSYETVSFERDGDAASQALEKALSTGPRVAIVLAEEDTGLFAAQQKSVVQRDQKRPEFVLGGFLSYDIRTPGDRRNITAFGDLSVDEFAVKAFQTVQRLMEAKAIPEKTEVPIHVRNASMILVPNDSRSQETSPSS